MTGGEELGMKERNCATAELLFSMVAYVPTISGILSMILYASMPTHAYFCPHGKNAKIRIVPVGRHRVAQPVMVPWQSNYIHVVKP